MELRVGNLVRHKSGGPIMIVEELPWPGLGREMAKCVWVEDGQKKLEQLEVQLLQAVYTDGSPRNYDNEKQA